MNRAAFLIALLASAATAVAAQPVLRDQYNRDGPRGGELVLYEHDGFGGRQVVLNGPAPNLTRYGFNDAASSLRSSGRWEVCEHVNFQGRCFPVEGEQWSLSGFNDRISSARPLGGRGGNNGGSYLRDQWPSEPSGPGQPINRRGAPLILFQDAGFGGRTVGISDDEPDLNRYGFNDAASSVRVRGGTWRVCSDAYFQGTCLILQSDLANLSDLRLNDRISSIQRMD